MATAPDKAPFRMTRQRRMILEQLRKVCSHPTADAVHRMVRRRAPRISLGTVYRNLEMLAESGQIRRLDVAGRQRRYDGNLEHHYHVHCERCGRIDDVFAEPVARLENTFVAAAGYDVLGYRLELFGVCPHCRACPRRAKPGPRTAAERPEGRRGTA